MSKTVTNFLDAIETPSDINEHLVALYSLAGRCHSVAELGVRYALSSTALIAARPDSLKSYDIELSPEALRIFKDGEKDGVNCQLIQSSSFDVTLDDVTNWIDDMDLSNIQTIIDAWTSSLQSSEYIQNGFKAMSNGEEGIKKK
jgi:hypothetical protein